MTLFGCLFLEQDYGAPNLILEMHALPSMTGMFTPVGTISAMNATEVAKYLLLLVSEVLGLEL